MGRLKPQHNMVHIALKIKTIQIIIIGDKMKHNFLICFWPEVQPERIRNENGWHDNDHDQRNFSSQMILDAIRNTKQW